MICDHQLLIQKDISPSGNLVAEVGFNKAASGKLAGGKPKGSRRRIQRAT
jgi:hypothetical protein